MQERRLEAAVVVARALGSPDDDAVAAVEELLRGGLQRTWIRTVEMDDLDGQGYVLGVGLDYAFPLAALWLELDREFLDLAQGAGQYQGTADTLMAGVRVGI